MSTRTDKGTMERIRAWKKGKGWETRRREMKVKRRRMGREGDKRQQGKRTSHNKAA